MENVKKIDWKKIKTYSFYMWIFAVILIYIYDINKISGVSNKTMHLMVYFFTAFFGYIYFSNFIKSKKLLSVSAVAFACAYGSLIEYSQYLLLHRAFSTDNIMTNCVGALVFGIIVIPKRPLTINGRRV